MQTTFRPTPRLLLALVTSAPVVLAAACSVSSSAPSTPVATPDASTASDAAPDAAGGGDASALDASSDAGGPLLASDPTTWQRCGTCPWQDHFTSGADVNEPRNGHASMGFASTPDAGRLGAIPDAFGALRIQTPAAPALGGRVRLRADVKTKDVVGWAGLWMRIDGAPGQVLALDNMQVRPITGTNDWASHDVVLDVPANAQQIVFGVILTGDGAVWVADAKLETVGADVPPTAPAVGSQVPGATQCPNPDPLAGWQPPAYRPAAHNVGACTPAQIDAYYTACSAGTPTDCTAFEKANLDCARCLETTDTAAAWGAFVTLMQGGAIPNVAGCVELSDPSNGGACAAWAQAGFECDQAACNTQCRITDNATGQAWTTCTQNAEQSASCQRYLTGGPCDGGSPVVATCNPRAGESAQAYVARIGELFCGGPADAGTD